MEFNLVNILAGLSIVVTYIGIAKIDSTMKDGNVEGNIRLKVNSIMLVIGTLVVLLSGYILFW